MLGMSLTRFLLHNRLCIYMDGLSKLNASTVELFLLAGNIWDNEIYTAAPIAVAISAASFL